MESKLNLIAIQDYSEDLTGIFLNELKGQKSHFSGKDILSLNEVKQVNLFILKEIFFSWKAQNIQMRSPYFDFDNKEVSASLEDFMNLLSRHIKVPFELMHGLYSLAIRDTILFYLVPDYFLVHFINELNDEMLNRETLNQYKTYLDLNRKMYENFLAKIDTEKIDISNKEKLGELIHSISFDAEEKEIFDYFSSKKNLDIELFLKIEETEESEVKPKAESFKEGKSYQFDNEQIVNEKYKSESGILNDKLKGEKSSSLLDNMQKQKINNISKSISLNQRFVFIKELFGGNLDNYDKALNTLDSFNSWEEANQFIEEELAPEYNWDISKESVAEFNEIIERKYK